jgi:cell wall-associated NlpC family hydrolase
MEQGICHLNCIAIRREADNASEMTSQLLFGETFHILDETDTWYRIYSHFDHYEGWVLKIQVTTLLPEVCESLRSGNDHCSGELVALIVDRADLMQVLTLGASLPCYSDGRFKLGTVSYAFEGEVSSGVAKRSDLVRTAHKYLNTPFLWGGRTPAGIDSSGFTQMVYKINGYMLFRDAHQQASQGEVLSFIEECEPGDLAFFDNEEGEIIHVGILLAHNHIIHCHGKVRIDRIDHSGIYNVDIGRHTHRLRVMKRILE